LIKTGPSDIEGIAENIETELTGVWLWEERVFCKTDK